MITVILACAALAIAVAGLVLWPLFRAKPLAAGTVFDQAVYRDQLRELDQDIARGLITPDAAQPARLEIQRRLIAAGRQEATARAGVVKWRYAAPIGIMLLVAPSALYLKLGSPNAADHPASQAATPATAAADGHNDLTKSLAALEARLEREPDNAERWMLYARTTASLGEWEKSIRAYGQVMRLAPNEPDVLAGYGEMLVMAADGVVTPAARKAFADALVRDPANDVARFYSALAAAQAGESRQAIDIWLKLLADVPEDSEMRDEIGRRIAESAQIAGIPAPPLPPGRPAAPPPPAPALGAPSAATTSTGPSPDAVAAAADMDPAARDAMVRSMVARLAEKLEKEPNDADGWLRVGRAWLVLKEAGKSASAYDKAAALRPGDTGLRLEQAIAIIDTLDDTAPVPELAESYLAQAKLTSPDRPEIYWYLGIAAARRGARATALAHWRQVLGMLRSDSPDRAMVQQAIKAIE